MHAKILLAACLLSVIIFIINKGISAQSPVDSTNSSRSQATTSTQDVGNSEAVLLFEKKCYSCHTIGQGDKKGPDLKNVATRRTRDWLIKYIPSPKTMKNNGDPAAIDLFQKYSPEEMTDQDLTGDQITMILDLITSLSNQNKPFIPSGAHLSRTPSPDDIPMGRQLFTGQVVFKNAGRPCISCHTVSGEGILGGGTLGPDLTQVNIKFTVPELINILQNPNFPLMSKVFAGNIFTDDEIVQLIAFFQDVKIRQSKIQSDRLIFIYCGIGLTILLLLLVSWIWRNRFTEVRKSLMVHSGNSKDTGFILKQIFSHKQQSRYDV